MRPSCRLALLQQNKIHYNYFQQKNAILNKNYEKNITGKVQYTVTQ
jgi:hypothetical protein